MKTLKAIVIALLVFAVTATVVTSETLAAAYVVEGQALPPAQSYF